MKPLHYVFALIFMLGLDAAWIGGNKSMYANAAQRVQNGRAMQLNVPAAVLSYVLVYAALVGVCLPAVTHPDAYENVSGSFVADAAKRSVVHAGVLGFLVYGIYNLTTKAVLHKYPWKVCVLDTMWGSFMFTAVCFFATVLTKAIYASKPKNNKPKKGTCSYALF